MTDIIGLIFEAVVLQPFFSCIECIIGLMKPLPPTPYARQLRWLAIFFLGLCPLSFSACVALSWFSFYAALGAFALSLIAIYSAGVVGGKLIALETPNENQKPK